jgi:hypothetical protein
MIMDNYFINHVIHFIVQHLPSCEGKQPSNALTAEVKKQRRKDTVGGMGFQAMSIHHPFCPVTIGPPLFLSGCGDLPHSGGLMVRKAYDSQDLQPLHKHQTRLTQLRFSP